MKSSIRTTAFSSLLFSFVAVISLPASSVSLQPTDRQPFLMLAEGGGDRLIQYQEMQAQRSQTTDTSERFAQLVEEEPTAAGARIESDEVESVAKPAPGYKSLIHQQKVEFGH
ncbi:hypothetical protein E8F11_24920 [Pseudomonas sp. BN417]|uniref:hypothetical protein n=1 Tax=Pseudomonas sp. BN417 TaxID=2567890 RepID=UPI00245771A5|nr:hypothetical protein [Pseudomonas sp. BN417]MDH4558376.1 hypothetical protein [Pseudomonas sp. BN417]